MHKPGTQPPPSRAPPLLSRKRLMGTSRGGLGGGLHVLSFVFYLFSCLRTSGSVSMYVLFGVFAIVSHFGVARFLAPTYTPCTQDLCSGTANV